MNESKAGLASDDLWTRLANSLRGYTGDAQGQIRRMGDELDLSKVQATSLHSALTAAINTDDPSAYADALRGVRGQLTAVSGGVENMTGSQRAFYEMLVESEDKARQLAALDMATPVSAAADEAARLAEKFGLSLGLARQLANVGKKPGGTVSGFESNDPRNPSNAGKWTGGYSTSWEAWTPKKSRGGGGANLTDDLTRTTAAMREQGLALEALAAGRYSSEEAARLWAQAMVEGNGTIDAQTAAMLVNIDTMAQRNEAMRNAPADFGKELAAGTETALENAIREGLTGGKPSIQNFAKAIQSHVAGALAKSLATKITSGLGLDRLFNAGGTTAAAQMQAGIVTGGNIAAQTIAQAVATGNATAAATGGGGGSGNWLSTALNFAVSAFTGVPMFKEGGFSDAPHPFANAPHYAEGTSNTSNGIPAVLHPNEAVVPLTRGRKIPVEGAGGGGNNFGDINIATTVNVEGDSNAEDSAKIAQAVGETVDGRIRQILAEESAYGGIMNPRGGY
ncbi:hypothetical protein [Antarcticimicrobium luteum]|uniref:Uncharacterized protein n=1 Tax=Antarcticimicrobium luteum TaxID=2547397 RepID=A0A4R5VDK1_9RHOB|nr:hypothetical protein [Antarcticimicrobium luteum]TDK50426.1 hypothetical protein E1832_06325 [Antarcticimicrobium luteum]